MDARTHVTLKRQAGRMLLALAGGLLIAACCVFFWPGVETKADGMDRLVLTIQLIGLSAGLALIGGILLLLAPGRDRRASNAASPE